MANKPINNEFPPDLYEELTSSQEGTGIEAERSGNDAFKITEPFDPEAIDVKTKNMTVGLIVERIRGGDKEIDLMPDFQRRAGVWDQTRKSRLVESLLLRIPLPVFYVASDGEERWSVVDGLQRITTLKEFIHDKSLVLNNLEFLQPLNGKGFDGLNRQMQRRIQESEVTVHIIQPGTPSEVMFNIFKRINTGGMPLSPQEIRHAIKQGASTRLLKKLAESQEFKAATQGSVRDERMADRECILRFFAFSLLDFNKYSSGSLDTLLIQTMEQINNWPENEIKKWTQKFSGSMIASKRILGRWAFRKYYGPNYRLSPINKALFEVWSVLLANLSPDEVDFLAENKSTLMMKYAAIHHNNYDFIQSISVGTGDANKVKRRFSEIKKLINEVLDAD